MLADYPLRAERLNRVWTDLCCFCMAGLAGGLWCGRNYATCRAHQFVRRTSAKSNLKRIKAQASGSLRDEDG